MQQVEAITSAILNRLSDCQEAICEQWNNPVGTPTKHFVVDELLPEATCAEIYDAFPRDGNGFFNRESFREKKRTSANLSSYPEILSDAAYGLQDVRVVEYVSKLIGIDSLEPDPKLYAGGLSMMFQGDFLNPHIDNSHDGDRQKYRRVNLLYYVSPDWAAENGGNFELWDEKQKVQKTITSKTNRLIVMETTKKSWHSVSPVTVDRPRCCVSSYYFSEESPDSDDYFHVTSFTGRPEEKFRRALGAIDNAARNGISKLLKVGRGKHLVNDDERL
jgi:Rps23 Pro-64 3,4-dihydroxylase Tpa1-like proline 4-hydroxylase